MRPRIAVPMVALLAASGLGLFAPGTAGASCAGPTIVSITPEARPAATPSGQTRPVVLHPGEAITVTGRGFIDGCNDTPGPGCMGGGAVTQKAAHDVALVLNRSGSGTRLGQANAGDPATGYSIEWQVTLPTDLPPGSAQLTADAATARVIIRP